ncbi:MAG: hypothetical protein ACK5SX_04495 [Sandaracinobacter sp.]
MRVDTVDPHEPISLREFVALAERDVDPDQPETVWAMRHSLARLAYNTDWIFRIMEKALQSRLNSAWGREQPSYFVLYNCLKFAIRANIWLPECHNSEMAILENAAFSYDYPHDHNFDILTINCLGPGYETDIYTYDKIDDDATIGQRVRVKPLGRHRLSRGTVFMYETCRDIHTQLPVDDITVTLNFLPLRTVNYARPQFIFEALDDDIMRIVGVPMSPEGRQMSAIRMLTKLASNGFDVAGDIRRIARADVNKRLTGYAEASGRLLAHPATNVTAAIVDEIDGRNVAFKYYEVARMSRALR